MNVPNLPVENFIDKKTNDVHESWKKFLDELITTMKGALSEEGILMPHQTGTIITSLNTSLSTGKFLYNTTTDKAMVCENGTFKTITTT